MTTLNFEKCVSKPKQRIVGTTTNHQKKQHEPTFPNDHATQKRHRSKQLSEHHSELLDNDSLQGLKPLQQCALRQHGQRFLEPCISPPHASATSSRMSCLGNAHINQLDDTAPRQTALRSQNPCRWSTRWLLPSIKSSPAP